MERERSVLVIGESLVDLVETTDGDGEPIYRPRFGGSPLNVAVGAARLGVRVEFATALAGDSFGRKVRAFLEQEGVDLLAPDLADAGTCLAVGSRSGTGVEYEYFGDVDGWLRVQDLNADEVVGCAVVHAGSTALLADPVLRVVRDAFSVPGPIRTLDPNCRPTLIPDRDRYLGS